MFNLNSNSVEYAIQDTECHEIKCPRLEISCFLDSHHMPSAHAYTGINRKSKEAILW